MAGADVHKKGRAGKPAPAICIHHSKPLFIVSLQGFVYFLDKDSFMRLI